MRQFATLRSLALGLILPFLSLAVHAREFAFYNLDPQKITQPKCEPALQRKVRQKKVRLQDEANVILTVWNVESVENFSGKFQPARLDPVTGRYQYQPRPEQSRPLEDWKFAAKQKKLAEVGRWLDLPKAPLSHFVVAPEVESREAADKLFDSGPLKGKYQTYMVAGNDTRKINIAFAVRADLDVKIEVETHRDTKWYDPIEGHMANLFSRDIPALIVRDRVTDKVQMVLLGTHYKSMRDRADGFDPQSSILRSAQMAATAKIIRSYRARFGEDVPLILAGDFNTDVRTAPEVKPIQRELTDAFDVLQVEERTTHTYHPLDLPTVKTQLDAAMVSDSVRPHLLMATVLPEFHPEHGEPLDSPKSLEERKNLFPSDHRAISVVVSGKLFQ